MKKKNVIGFALAFLLGLIIGGIAAFTYFGFSFKNLKHTFAFSHFAAEAEKAFEAYMSESPEVARWALENFIQTSLRYGELYPEDKRVFQTDLILTYLRLAKVHKSEQKNEKYNEYMSRAFALAQKAWTDEKNLTHERLIEFVEKADRSGGKTPRY